ncbi:MAG: flagellar export protein FliJ [Lachnospiraceae bacterium]|nr:flagellar export protein FliJ [Lachnospiraceae bacterium]
MARFRYRMQNILNIKLKEEEQQKTAFGLAQARLNEEQDKLAELIERRQGYFEDGRRMRLEAISVMDLKENQGAVEVMDTLIASQRASVARAEKNLELERQRLTVCIQERKIHERLREKAYERFLAEERAEEAKINDERSSFVYGQRS